MKFGDLFEREPPRWGLRGDPHLWRVMRERFADVPLPTTEWELVDNVDRVFREVTGVPLDGSTRQVSVPAFHTGSGISDGFVDGTWWNTVGRTLLLDRWIAAGQK